MKHRASILPLSLLWVVLTAGVFRGVLTDLFQNLRPVLQVRIISVHQFRLTEVNRLTAGIEPPRRTVAR